MKKEINKHKELIHFIIAVEKYRRPSVDNELKEIEKIFNSKQSNRYAKCISKIKDLMFIPKSVHLDIKSVKSLPGNVGARIYLYRSILGTPIASKNEKFKIEILNDTFNDFDRFVVFVAHEIAHLLFSLNKSKVYIKGKRRYLTREEKAVDTLVIMSGFGDAYKRYSLKYSLNSPYNPEYIDKKEFDFLYMCYKSDKRFRVKKQTTHKKQNDYFKDIFSNIDNLFRDIFRP